jgi:succinate dehydrogenase / fumarate reductase flavoprotein subunit
MWEYCGMERTEDGPEDRDRQDPRAAQGLLVQRAGPRQGEELNQSLEKAGRVADFLELGELMCIDALHRRESCGGHFRAESQTEDGEALRHDDEFSTSRRGNGAARATSPVLHKEPLVYEFIELKQRSYK